ncbi:MAG: 30S ribosomal protein S9 [bacterium]
MEEWYATGRRKTAVARTYLRPGTGKIFANKKEPKKHFFVDKNVDKLIAPLKLTKNEKTFDVFIFVNGGGVNAQAEAARHGISQALVKFKAENRSVLKKAGYLRRDDRMKERKKYGKKGARASFQFSKR